MPAKKIPAKKVPAKKSAAKKTAAKKAAVKKKAAPRKAAAKKAPAKKVPAAASGPVTRVVAEIDVGFGNELYLRGEGGGLSWDRGVLMDCVEANLWTWSGAASTGIAFKFLINDELWSLGEDLTVPPGGEIVTAPRF